MEGGGGLPKSHWLLVLEALRRDLAGATLQQEHLPQAPGVLPVALTAQTTVRGLDEGTDQAPVGSRVPAGSVDLGARVSMFPTRHGKLGTEGCAVCLLPSPWPSGGRGTGVGEGGQSLEFSGKESALRTSSSSAG